MLVKCINFYIYVGKTCFSYFLYIFILPRFDKGKKLEIELGGVFELSI